MSYLTPSHFGGFLLHRGSAFRSCDLGASYVLSAGCNAVSPRQYIHRADHIGVFLESTVHTHKPGLCPAVVRRYVTTGRTGLAGPRPRPVAGERLAEPTPERHWQYTQSIAMIRGIFENRMFPLTLDGIGRAVKALG